MCSDDRKWSIILSFITFTLHAAHSIDLFFPQLRYSLYRLYFLHSSTFWRMSTIAWFSGITEDNYYSHIYYARGKTLAKSAKNIYWLNDILLVNLTNGSYLCAFSTNHTGHWDDRGEGDWSLLQKHSSLVHSISMICTLSRLRDRRASNLWKFRGIGKDRLRLPALSLNGWIFLFSYWASWAVSWLILKGILLSGKISKKKLDKKKIR